MFRWGLWASVAVLLSAGLASGDLGAVTWAGGTLRLMDDHPTISLTSEKLVLEPQPTTTLITASMEFHNHGEACTAQMGFPVLEASRGPGYHYVESFVLEADGKPMEFAQPEQSHKMKLGEREMTCKWYLFSVPFEAGQTRQMQVRYEELRRYSGLESVSVPYVLATGATWNGSIRDLELEIWIDERLNYHSIELKGDGQPLALAARDGTWSWEIAEYDGTPGLLWLTAGLGPKSVQRDGKRQYYGFNHLRWDEGVLFVEQELLCDVLMAQMASSAPAEPRIEKEGKAVQLTAVASEVPQGEHGETKLFVDPRPALAAFGGAIEVNTDEAGDAHVSITTCPDSAEAARNTALYREQETKYRLRCLRALHDRWPDELVAVCEEITGRDTEKAAVLTWAVAYLADAQPESVDLGAMPAKLELRAANWVQELAETILASQSDRIVRGGAMLLRQADPEAARDALIYRISECEDWQDGVHRGRNAGLALRLLKTPDAASALIQAVRSHEWHQPSEDAMIALGFLGDESAIDFLHDTALDPADKSRDIICVAAQSLSYLGTPPALEACADVWLKTDDAEVRWRALLGVRIAVGAETYTSRFMPALAPEWGRPMSVEEGCRACLPLLERLKPKAAEAGKEREIASLINHARDTLAVAEAVAGGG